MSSPETMQHVWTCVSPAGLRMKVLAATPVAAQEMSAKRFKCLPETVLMRYSYSTGARHVPEKVERP